MLTNLEVLHKIMKMRPSRIILVRHGESVGNVDKSIYNTIPDYALQLTDRGHQQAADAGVEISKLINGGDLMCYVSSYTRTKQTYQDIIKNVDAKSIKIRTDPRIREQEWRGNLGSFCDDFETERDDFGHFFYRFPNGESCADVYDRISNFLDTLFRDFEKPDYPDNVLIVTHGMAMRVFLMRWFNLPVEQFERLRNPKNCQLVVLERGDQTKYTLTKDLEIYPEPTHPYHFPI